MLFCELCYPADECTCGGCQCKWCRYARGDDLLNWERRQINAHIAAHRAFDARQAARNSAKNMAENIANLLAKNSKPI